MANGTTYLTRTLSSGADRTKGTWSFWIKRGDVEATTQQGIFGGRKNSSNDGNLFQILLQHNNNGAGVQCAFWNSSGTNLGNKRTSNAMRDLSAWYHVVCTIDTTLATADDRIKIYVNGERITNLESSPNTNPSQNDTFAFFNNYSNHQQMVGGFYATGSTTEKGKLNGILSHVHACDGYAYDASEFGETDSTTGEWKIKTSPSVSYGTNGFFLFKDDNAVTDRSGQGNNFTLGGGTLTKTEDNPSNVFCTLNPLATGNSAPTFSKGNNTVTANASGYQFSCGTIAVPLTGKWYWEVKANDNVNGSSTEYLIGAVLESRLEASGNFAEFAADGIAQYGSVSPGIGQNDIIGVSVDRTAATLKIYKNNSLILTKSSLPAELIYPMVTVYGSVSADANFGNGYFGTTAVSSAGTNASNNGIFEYDVIPSDANALSTNGLNL